MLIWHNGQFIQNQPVFSANDRIRLGDGVFDTMGAVDGKLQHSQKHFDRLHRHAHMLGIEIPFTQEDLISAAQESLEKQSQTKGHALIRTIVTRGQSFRGIGTPDKPDIQVVMRSSNLPAPDNMPSPNIIIATRTRRNEHSPLSQIKSLQYADNILAKMEADEKGANDAILLNTAGALTCSTTGNIYILRTGKLLTPPQQDGVIDGIMRSILLEQGHAAEQTLSPEDLQDAEGIYISNSLRGLEPVRVFEGKQIKSPALNFTIC